MSHDDVVPFDRLVRWVKLAEDRRDEIERQEREITRMQGRIDELEALVQTIGTTAGLYRAQAEDNLVGTVTVTGHAVRSSQGRQAILFACQTLAEKMLKEIK